MILYKLRALPISAYTGFDSFRSTLYHFELHGLTYSKIKNDLDQRLLFPDSYERILTIARAFAADAAFPDTVNASNPYYSYGLMNGLTPLNTAAAANTFGKVKFAGLVAREQYMRNFAADLAHRYATTEEIEELGFSKL